MNKVRSIQQELDRYLKTWGEQPLTISVWSDFSVAQYRFDSIDALEQKLAQFPSGTEFIISKLENAKNTLQSAARLRTFLVSHGMSIKEERVVVPNL